MGIDRQSFAAYWSYEALLFNREPLAKYGDWLRTVPTDRINATERLVNRKPDGGRDLNSGSSDRETNCVNSCGIVKDPARIIELDDRAANLVLTDEKAFYILVERTFLKTSGEGGTAIELFIAGVRGWDTGLRRVLAASADEK